MKRTLAAVLVLLTGAAAAVAYTVAARDREYRRLLAAGEAAAASGQPVLAVEAFSGALALKADSMVAFLKRGEMYRQQGDLSAALRDVRTAHQLDPLAARPLEDLGDLNYALGSFERAYEFYTELARLDDRSARARYKMGLAAYQAARPAAAIAHFESALTLDPEFGEAQYLRGLALRADGREREARTALEEAVRLEPALTPAREALADLARDQRRTRDAIAQHQALVKLEPDQPGRVLALALAYADAGRTEQAVRTLVEATDVFPSQPDIYTTLGDVWLRAAERRSDRAALSKALEALRTAQVHGASSSRVLTLYGRALLFSGDTPGALRALTEAAGKRPAGQDTFFWLDEAEQRSGHLREARDALVRYWALAEPRPPALAARIGELSTRIDDHDAAARWLARAAAHPTADVPLLLRLAEAELAAGNDEGARQAVSRGLTRAPDDPRLKKLDAELDRRDATPTPPSR
jgi:tetratricopeptide (TPR) repeat protein